MFLLPRPAGRAVNLREKLAEYPDFPKKGVLFRDFGPLLRDPEAFSYAADQIKGHFPPGRFDAVAGIEARGFPVAALVAARCGRGMVMIRKKGKLPGGVIRASYQIEYGSDTMEMQEGAVQKGDRVLVCDDLLATGGTAEAAASLVEKAGGKVAGFAFVVELSELGGAARLGGRTRKSLVVF